MAGIKKGKTALKFDKPSSWWGALWREGLPLGNGVTGASVLGGAASDTIMLTHCASLWQGYVGVLPDISDKLKEVRKLIEEGRYKQAEEVYPNALINKNYRPQSAVPLPICDLKIKMPVSKPVKEYSRVLNMENGEATVSYKDGAAKFERSMFVSRENDCFICEISKGGNAAIDAEFSFDMHDRSCNKMPLGLVSKLPEGIMAKYENYFMYFSERNDGGAESGAVARISHYGGTQEVRANSIKIKGANNILVIVKLFVESQREKEWKNLKLALSANKLNYDRMLKDHTLLHSKLFNSSELDLNAADREISSEDLLKSAYCSSMGTALIEKLWYYGRYLFISSARASGSVIVNPYGLWCGDYKAVSSCANLNGETQALYAAAFDGNLCDMALPLINYYENALADLKKNALRLYNCKGIFVPAITSPGTGLLGSTEAKDIYFTAAAGSLASVFYDYYCYTGDKKFLKERALPFMREAASFYEDFLKIGDDGLYICSPSYSPDCCPGNLYEEETGYKVDIAKNSEVDFAVLRQLLSNLLNGAEICGLYKEETAKWQDMLTKIPKPAISSAGFVREYNSAEFSDNYKTGGGAQFYGVYPGSEINCQSGGEIKKAYINSVKRRVADGITTLKGSTLAYLANVSSRLCDGETALELLNQLAKTCIMNNLVTTSSDWRNMGFSSGEPWAAYQINGNTGMTAAITSLFVQSDYQNIYILPAASEFKSGSISGVLTRCGCEVNLEWDYKKGLVNFNVKAKKSAVINIRLPDGSKRISKGAVTAFDENLFIKNVEIAGGKSVNFEIKV